MNGSTEAGTTSSPNTSIAILGVPFDNVTTPETIALVERMVASRKPHYFVTANVDFLVQAQEDIELRRILFDANLVLCDGTPLVWASRLLGNPLPERVAGSDLVPLLVRIAAEKTTASSSSVALRKPPNARSPISRRSIRALTLSVTRRRSTNCSRWITTESGGASPRRNRTFCSFRLAAPKQEKWIAMHYVSLGVPVSAGVGGTIDFLAGQMKRAPVWMQRTGTEWIFRMLQEPRRLFRRYVKDLWVFSRSILAQWWQLRSRRKKGQPNQVSSTVLAETTWQWIQLPERLDLAAVRNDVLLVDQVLADGRHCILQMNQVNFIDSTGMGLLIRLQKKIRATGRQLVLLDPSAALKRALQLMHLQDFFATAPDFDAARELIAARTAEQNALGVIAPGKSSDWIHWQGEITAANAEKVWQITEKQILAADRASRRLVIDLAQVRFMDSSGMGIMIRARKLAQLHSICLKFTGAQPAVQNVLRLARLNEFLLEERP